jgi:hypothetical protein
MDVEQRSYWNLSARNATERIAPLSDVLVVISLSTDKIAAPIAERALHAPHPAGAETNPCARAEALEEYGAMLDAALIEIAGVARSAHHRELALRTSANHRHAGGAHWGDTAA